MNIEEACPIVELHQQFNPMLGEDSVCDFEDPIRTVRLCASSGRGSGIKQSLAIEPRCVVWNVTVAVDHERGCRETAKHSLCSSIRRAAVMDHRDDYTAEGKLLDWLQNADERCVVVSEHRDDRSVGVKRLECREGRHITGVHDQFGPLELIEKCRCKALLDGDLQMSVGQDEYSHLLDDIDPIGPPVGERATSYLALTRMSGDDGLEQLKARVDDGARQPPEYLTFPLAERALLLTPEDLAEKGHASCPSKGRLVGSISNGIAFIPVQRDLRCGRVPGHDGVHLQFISNAGSPELSWFYSWGDASSEAQPLDSDG